jgi:pseudaminic acid cytidylyltransferase
VKIAVIPARGKSKRIPRKNLREFAGKPIIAHSIKRAIESSLFDRVIVSTDDDEIAAVSKDFGADVPFCRPAELSDDYAGTTAVVAHCIRELSAGVKLSAVCCIYPTAPFLRVEDLQRGRELLDSGSWSYAFSAAKLGFPVMRSFGRDREGGIEMLFPEHFGARSQDLPEAWHDAGQFYWGRPEAWLENLRIFDKWSTVVEIPPWRAQDIDTPEDWHRAELMWRVLSEVEPGE